MLTPDKLKKAFNKVEDENWTLRSLLLDQGLLALLKTARSALLYLKFLSGLRNITGMNLKNKKKCIRNCGGRKEKEKRYVCT